MENTILTSDNTSASSSLNPPSRIICHVCWKQFSQYTCPRCNSRYCSLQCYKSHSLRCTESFMRDNVVEELRQMQPDDETKSKMLGILKQYHSEESIDTMDEDDSCVSEETIQKILSGGEVTFYDLSPEEKKKFQRALASGELSKMIEPWNPWWLKPSARTISLGKGGTPVVQPILKQETSVSEQDLSENAEFNEIPPGPETSLPPVSKLSSKEPSPLLAIHLVDIVYGYCFTLRLFNGDWKSDAIGSAMVLISVSAVLGQGAQPETVREALSHCLEQVCSPAFRHVGGVQFGLGLIDDVISLFSSGAPALICLLCDVQRLVQAGQKELMSEKPKKHKRDEVRSTLKLAERKAYFIMCWVYEQPEEAWSSFMAIIRTEKQSAMDFRNSKRDEVRNSIAETKGNVLIEEMK